MKPNDKEAKLPELEELLAAAEESLVGSEDLGFCIACGAEAMNVEPDAEN